MITVAVGAVLILTACSGAGSEPSVAPSVGGTPPPAMSVDPSLPGVLTPQQFEQFVEPILKDRSGMMTYASNGEAICTGLRGGFRTFAEQVSSSARISSDPYLFAAASVIAFCPEQRSVIPPRGAVVVTPPTRNEADDVFDAMNDITMEGIGRELVVPGVEPVAAAKRACDALHAGREAQYVLDSFVHAGMSKYATYQFVVHAVGFYCNEQMSRLPSFDAYVPR